MNVANIPTVCASALTGGTFISTLTPFDEYGSIMYELIPEQTRRLSSIRGVLGISVHAFIRERLALSLDERVEIVRQTRCALDARQPLLVCLGGFLEDCIDEVRAYQMVGANAVICFPAGPSLNAPSEDQVSALAEEADRLPLPVIIALENGGNRWARERDDITALARNADRVLGFDMGGDENVVQYDHDYYALKSLDRPLTCLASSEGALFHNLNTGSDGVLSSLAFIAPHEVSELYRASRDGRFSDAQAVHNRLYPLIAQLRNQDSEIREMVYREAAYQRGVLGSVHARGITKQLCETHRNSLAKTLLDIGLRQVSRSVVRP